MSESCSYSREGSGYSREEVRLQQRGGQATAERRSGYSREEVRLQQRGGQATAERRSGYSREEVRLQQRGVRLHYMQLAPLPLKQLSLLSALYLFDTKLF